MASQASNSWIYHFWARFWPNFNVVDFTWQFLIRTFLRVSAFPYPEKLLLQIIVHCSSCTGEIFLLQQVFNLSFFYVPVKKKTDVFHLKIFFSCPCIKCYPAQQNFPSFFPPILFLFLQSLILCSSFCHSSAYLPPDEVQYELPLLDGCRSAAKNPLQNPREMLQIWRKVG